MKFVLVLTQYKRNHLERQLKAINNQTLKPDYLVVFQNEGHKDISNLNPWKFKIEQNLNDNDIRSN